MIEKIKISHFASFKHKHGIIYIRTHKAIRAMEENQDGGVGRHTAPPRTIRTDRESNGKGVRHQGNKK